MEETAKQIWAVISAIIALAVGAGMAYGLYNHYFLLPEYLDITGNLVYAVVVGLLVVAAVFAVLYKGVHPY